MAGDFNKPVVTDGYASVLQSIKDLISDLAKGLDGTGTTNIPTNAIRWSSTNNRFEKYNGSAWVVLTSTMNQSVNSVNGYSPSNASGGLAINNGTVNTNLNADLLDGVHASSLAYRGFLGGTDMNTYQTPGLYEYDPVVNGAPTGEPNHRVLWIGNSGRTTNLAFPYSTDRMFFRRNSDGTWGSWKEVWHSGNFTPNATSQSNIGAAGSYGGINIIGAAGGWAGFQFNSTSRYFMSSSGQTGEYDTAAGVWQWRWDSGTLAAGTVPWARLSGVPAMNYLPLSGGTLSGGLTVTSLNISSNANYITMVDTDWGNKYIHANGGLIGFLNNTGNWELYTNNSGQVWTSNYGWLHDRFAAKAAENYVDRLNNCASGPVSGVSYSLSKSGNSISIVGNNCNCNCCGGG